MKIVMKLVASNLMLTCFLVPANSNTKFGPSIEDEDITTCRQFAKHARFNPNSVLDSIWVVFYYWGLQSPLRIYKFSAPSTRYKNVLKKYLNETRLSYPVNWTNHMFIMTEKNTNISELIVQMGDRGEFLKYPIVKKIKKGTLIRPADLNFKQVENGKYLGFMLCSSRETYMMSRPEDIPKKRVIQDVAAKLGFRGPNGKSYLYQGHQWMPIPEAEDYEPDMFHKYVQH